MAYQRGCLKKVPRKDGDTWVLRFRVTGLDGRRVENTMPVGSLRDFPKEKDAWREVDKLGLLVRINEAHCPGLIRFHSLAEQYLRNDFGADAVRPKTERTVLNPEHIVRAYLIPRWGEEIADDIKPLDIQRWLKSLHGVDGLAWTTISKMRGTMLRVYMVGMRHELVTRNPVLPVETRCTTSYKPVLVTPQQTLAIIQGLPNILHRILVLTCAATALRFSELLALIWNDMLWGRRRSQSPNAGLGAKTARRRPARQKATSLFTRPRLSPEGMACANALRQGDGLHIPVAEGGGSRAAISRRLCCRPSAAGSSERRASRFLMGIVLDFTT